MSCQITGTIIYPDRPCMVDGKNALFHKWVVEDREITYLDIANSRVTPAMAQNNLAIVEFEDGHVEMVKPERVTFLDSRNRFDEYMCFVEKDSTADQWANIVDDMKSCVSFGYSLLSIHGYSLDTYTSLLDRYNRGERSDELYDEMMAVNLMKKPDERKK